MYFKVHINTPTGDKLENLFMLINEVRQRCQETCEKHGFKGYAHSRNYIAGAPLAFCAPLSPVNVELFYKKGGNYYPRKRHTQGKQIAEELKTLPRVPGCDLTDTVCTPGPFEFSRPGVCWSHSAEFITVAFPADFSREPSPDLEEITYSEYRQLSELCNNAT